MRPQRQPLFTTWLKTQVERVNQVGALARIVAASQPGWPRYLRSLHAAETYVLTTIGTEAAIEAVRKAWAEWQSATGQQQAARRSKNIDRLPRVVYLRFTPRAEQKLCVLLGMVVDGQPCGLRGAWVEFARRPDFLKHWLDDVTEEMTRPQLVGVTQLGIVVTHDPDECVPWDNTPDDSGGWRQTLVPWANIMSITGDQAS